MSILNRRVTRKASKFPRVLDSFRRLRAAVEAARPSRGLAPFESLETRTLFASAPTLSAVAPFSGAIEDTAYSITYAQLKAASDAADADGDTIKFRIEAVSTGLLKKGTSLVSAGVTLVAPGETLSWTPGANANGMLNAFTVKAYDGALASASPVQVKVDVAAVNDAPVISSVNTLTGGTEDTAYTITYANLAAAAQGATDPDGDPIAFQFAAASSGKLYKNGQPVIAGDNILAVLNPGESWVWVPANNAFGTLNAFTVKTYDGLLSSGTAAQVKVAVAAVNDAPTLSTVNNLTGASEDTPFTITYSALAAASNIADVDGTAPMFRIESVSGGTLTKGGSPVVAGTTTLGTGETIVWTPAANLNGVLPAFTVKAYDGALSSATAVQVNVNVAAVNDAPVLTAIDTFTGGTEDRPYTISYEALVGGADVSDIDSTSIYFKIAAISSGTLTLDDGVNTGPVVAGTSLLKPGGVLYWVPAADANGVLNAFTVKANDGTLDSSTAVQVKVDVAAVADAPKLTTVNTLTGATEDTGYSITFANFLAAANESDADGDTISFRIETVTSGTLTKGGVAVDPGTTMFATGDTLVWTPDANANGTLNAFTVRASDGTLLSATPVQVKVTVAAVNDTPTLASISTLSGATEDTAFTITYAQLVAASDINDVDLAAGSYPLFRVDAVSTGTLKKGSSAIVAGTTTLGPGETLTWTPAADANGVLNAFTVKAYDGTAASAAAVQVKVGVAAVNDAPTLTGLANLTGAVEDSTFTIDYAKLNTAAAGKIADVDSPTINYQITALGSGSLTINGIPVSVGQVIDAATTLVWAPAANANGTGSNALTAFSVKATDGALLSTTAIPVKVDVANVNDAPTLSTISTLTGATEDTAFTITYATLNAASNAADIEGPVLFRIESTSTGTLKKGGVAVVDGTTTIGVGESLVWTPAANANGLGLNAFTVKAYDGSLASPTAVQVKVNVAAVNDAPTLTAVTPLTGATEDTPFSITYAALSAASNANDVDGTTPNFVITAVSTGTLTKNGVAVVPNTTQITPGDTLVWTPAANANGTGASALTAFSVKAYDGVLYSTAAVPVKVNVAAVNDAPTLTSVSNLTGASEDTAYNITYAALKAASNAADVENDTITFRIDSVVTGTLTKGGVAVDPGVTMLAAGDTLVWTPAANAYGTGIAALPIMTISAYDGAAYSAAPITVKADVANVNDAPTLTSITSFTGSDAATEDTPYVLTYAALAAAGDQADIDNSTILFRVDTVASGTLKKNGLAVTAGTTTLGPGESLVWTPASNANGTGITAFSVKAYDGALASATAIPVIFDVTAVNDAPSFSTVTNLAGTEDVGLTINFSDLVTNAVDPEGDTVQYKIMAVSSGTLTLNGSPVNAGTDTFASGDVLVWTSASNANGLLNAFTLVAGDGNDWSVTPVQVKVNVAAVNDGAPTLSATANFAGGTEDTPITFTYADLVAGLSLSDPDPEQVLTFRIDAVTSGTLTKNGVAVTAGTTTLAAGESLVWTPAANANGSAVAAFTVSGYDGVSYSSAPGAVTVDVAAVNDAPTFSTATTITGATEDTAFDIAFADLATNAADVDGDTISYRIESVVNGTLTKGGVAVTPGTTVFASGDTLQWTPSADANGTIGAFTLVATDGTLFSSTPVTVRVDVAATSDDPTLTAIATFTKGIQNTPLTISYADLLAASDLKDADGGAVMFRIESTDSGTLKKGGVAVTDGTTTLGPGESLVWTPASNVSGSAIGAFTVKGFDGTNASTAGVAVLVDVAHIAQMPTLSSVTTLTGATEDTAFDIAFADLVTDAVDPEAGAISYRIESVGSGTLTKGGVAVVPGVTLFSAGDTLRWTPAANANGSALTAFTVRASTAAGVSSAKVAVKVDVTAVNDAPILTAISPLNIGAAEDHDINITYAQLLAASDARDVDTGDVISFGIVAISSGTLTKNGVAVTGGVDTLGPGEVLVWHPDADANGVLNAFTVKAIDGSDVSATAIQVKMNVTPINDAPTLTGFSTLTGATAGTGYSVTYAALTAAGDQADLEGGTINFVVGRVLSGTLTKNGVAVIPGVTRIKAGDTLVWTSVANATGDTPAFTLFATDGQDLSASAVDVVINVT